MPVVVVEVHIALVAVTVAAAVSVHGTVVCIFVACSAAAYQLCKCYVSVVYVCNV